MFVTNSETTHNVIPEGVSLRYVAIEKAGFKFTLLPVLIPSGTSWHRAFPTCCLDSAAPIAK